MPSILHVFGSTFPAFGTSLLLGVMIVASYTFAVALAAGANGRPRSLQAARFGAYGTVALIGVAVACLAYAFVSLDFRIRYVLHYSDRSMPLHYLLTALWGGQDGSLLWWLFLLSAYVGVCVWWLGKRYTALQPYVIATLMGIILFFCVLMAFAANPFATTVASPRPDGEGLNPLLQNYWMVIHPPCLYTGFVGCSIPFAFAVAALVTGRLDHEWIVASRKWTLFCWMFLAIGNTLGMLWAYEELGWGGFWAWDPVENAAFMPFLTASAYVHSVMIQERRGLLKLWNVFLICLTFFLTIFGTFLTRSGMISSVHSFAQSSIGSYFAVFLLLLVVATTTLVLWRWPELRDIKPTRALRWAAVAAGWTVIGACLPGLYLVWRLPIAVGLRVTLIAAVAGAAVFVALEVVFRRIAHGLDVKARRPVIESVFSREFTFLLNNWILCSLLFFILIATTFPLISEGLTGEKVTVGPPFYKVWVQPLGLVLLLLMGIGTLFGWKKTSPDALRRVFRAPVATFVGFAALHFAFGRALGFPAVVYSDAVYEGALGAALRTFNAFTPVLGFSLCAFNAAVIVQEFALLLRARARTGSGEATPTILWWLGGLPGLLHTLFTLPPPSRRRYGGYIVHLGIVLMFVGFTGQSWNHDKEVSLLPGQSYELGDYSLTYVGARMEVDNSKRMVFAGVGAPGPTAAWRGASQPREVHLQEERRVSGHRGRDRPPAPRRPLSRGRDHQPVQQERRRLLHPCESPRELDLDQIASFSSPGASSACGRSSSSVSRASGRPHAERPRSRQASSLASCWPPRRPPMRRTCTASSASTMMPSAPSSARFVACAARAPAISCRRAPAKRPRRRARRSARRCAPARRGTPSSRSTRRNTASSPSPCRPAVARSGRFWVVPVSGDRPSAPSASHK